MLLANLASWRFSIANWAQMKSQLFCAVDLGAESGRVVSGRFDGEKLDLEPVHRFPNVPVRAPDTLYWDVLRLWSDISDGLAKVGRSGETVAGIGVDTWGVDFALLDERDELIGNPLHYRNFAPEGIERAAQIVAKDEIYARTGLQFLPFNTLYQLLELKRRAASSTKSAQTLLYMPDLFHFWLCGSKSNEYSVASTSQTLDARTRFVDEELLAKFELPAHWLGEIAQPGQTLGTLRPELAARLGLSSSTKVIAPAGHDTASAIAAVPFEPGSRAAYLSSGTWSLMGLELAQPLISARTQELGFTNEGGYGGTIRFLKNIAGLWLVQECRRAWAREATEYSYAQLTELASEVSGDGSFVEPDDARFVAPADMRTALRDYCRESGQIEPQTTGEIVRCCLDSLALKYRWTFARLEELGGHSLDALHVVGGGTQNALLCQLAADCLGKPVIAGPIEATAAGNVLIQAAGTGALGGLDDIRRVVRASFEPVRYEPRQSEKARWDEKFGRFEGFVR